MLITYKHKLLKAIKGSLVLLFMPFIIVAQTCPGPIVNVNGGNVHIRTGPSINYQSLGLISSGRGLVASGDNGGISGSNLWYYVDIPTNSNGSTSLNGWIFSYLIPNTNIDEILVVDNSVVNGLNVREGAGTNYDRVEWEPDGTTVKIWTGQRFPVTGSSGNWYRIDLTNNCSQKYGWVSGSYVTIENFDPDDCNSNSDIDVGITDYRTSPTTPIVGEDTDLRVTFENYGDVTVDVDIEYYVDGNDEGVDDHNDFQSGDTRTEYRSNYVFTSTTCRDVTIRLIVDGDTNSSNDEVTFQVCPEEPCEEPSITSQTSGGGSYCVGDNLTLSISATGNGESPSYRWYKNGSSISGATSSSYSVNSISSNNAGNYYCRVSNSCGSVIRLARL